MRLALIICLLWASSGRAQYLDDILVEYQNRYTPEKAWLHLDKSAYAPGETIWFKAYLMEDIFPAGQSKTLYIDWIGQDGKVLMHTVSPVVEGVTNGQMEIPSGFKGELLHIRAYTRWMLNFDTAFLYNRNIRILQPNSMAKKPAAQYTLGLFPEGGDLVAGVVNRIAVKVHDQWGIPAKVKGILKSDQEPFIDSIKIVHDGMGTLYLKPVAGIRYYLQWTDAQGKKHESPFPVIKNAGVAMQVNNNGKRKIITIHSSDSLTAFQKKLYLLGTMNGRKAFQIEIPLQPSQTIQRIIPTEALPSGIITFTLFDSDYQPLAERISFIDHGEYKFRPGFKVSHWGLGKRKKNEIEISLPDGIEPASLSIAVTDLALERDSSENIWSHFLLTSEIKGKVFNPAYYFISEDPAREAHLDLVMLTHGWRRFNWDQMVKGILPRTPHGRDTSYLALSGQLFGISPSAMSGNETLALFVKEKDSAAKMMFVQVDKQGRFRDPELILFDTVQVYYSQQSKTFGNAEARFMTERLPTPNYTAFMKFFVPGYYLSDTTGFAYHVYLEAQRARLEALRQGKIMEEVIIKSKTKSPIQVLEERYATGLFRSGDGYQFDLVNDPMAGSYMNIFNFLQARVPGLQVSTGINPSVTWRGGTPQFFLDEFQTEIDMVRNIPVTDIAYVKVIRPPFLGAVGGGANGAIAIYTKRGDDARTASSKGLASNTVFGYTAIREFYSPNYDRIDPRNEEQDLRTTIYWNPSVMLQGKKTIKLSFFNNDVTKAFRVVIEGMTKDGLLTHHEEIME